VKAHQKRRYVIALRYEGEQEDRYVITNLDDNTYQPNET
jgi:hypothetical protein